MNKIYKSFVISLFIVYLFCVKQNPCSHVLIFNIFQITIQSPYDLIYRMGEDPTFSLRFEWMWTHAPWELRQMSILIKHRWTFQQVAT